jgi:dGTPase
MKFNYENIYLHERLNNYHEYAELVIRTIYKFLKNCYEGKETMSYVRDLQFQYPTISQIFYGWLEKYSNAIEYSADRKYKNNVLFKLENEGEYLRSCIDFVSGMTDQFAIRIFEEIISF